MTNWACACMLCWFSISVFVLKSFQCWWMSAQQEVATSQLWRMMISPQFISSPSAVPTHSQQTGVSDHTVNDSIGSFFSFLNIVQTHPIAQCLQIIKSIPGFYSMWNIHVSLFSPTAFLTIFSYTVLATAICNVISKNATSLLAGNMWQHVSLSTWWMIK